MKLALRLLTISAALVAFTSARAATAIVFAGDTTDEPFVYQGINQTIGWEFVVNADLVVTNLGFYNSPGGLADPHPIGIWDPSGNLVAQAVVPAGTTARLEGNFRYVDIPPTKLPAGGPYVIGAVYYGQHPDLVNGVESAATMTINPSISLVRSRWIWAPVLTLPSNAGGANVLAYFGPNFQFGTGGTDIKMLDATTTDFVHIDIRYSVAGSPAPAFLIRAYISSDQTFDQTDDLPLHPKLGVSDELNRQPNADGSAKEYTINLTLSARAPIRDDHRFIIVVADPDGAIQETNEDNNVVFAVPLFALGEKVNRAGDKAQTLAETDSIRASGFFTGAILRGTDDFDRLIRLDTFPDIPPHPWGTPPFIFALETESQPWQREEDRLAQSSLLPPISMLVRLVHDDSAFRADQMFSINEAYDSTGVHGLVSLHYEGRALDLQVFNGAVIGNLGRLCGIAWLAGFDFVFFEPKKTGESNHHVHVSKQASFPTTINQQTIEEAILGARLLGLIDSAGIATALSSKLDGVEVALLAGNKSAALGKLGAFDNFINAQSGQHIDRPLSTLLLLNSLILQDRIQHLSP